MTTPKITQIRGLTITRYPDARGTNLADKSQPVIQVQGSGGFTTLLCPGDLLCLAHKTVKAGQATDAEIAEAILNDESIYAET